MDFLLISIWRYLNYFFIFIFYLFYKNPYNLEENKIFKKKKIPDCECPIIIINNILLIAVEERINTKMLLTLQNGNIQTRNREGNFSSIL